MRASVVVLWSAIAVVVLVAVGIFGTLVATGRVTLFPTPSPTPTTVQVAEPVIDTSYEVLVLNATPQQGLANATRDTIVAAGWSPDVVLAGDAGSEDFPTTTIFYATPADEGAARGLAQVIGGAEVAESKAYLPTDDPNTADVDESAVRQLTVVIGLDRTDATPAAEG